MCCSIKNACPSIASFAAAFNSNTGLLLSYYFFFKYYFTVVPSRSCISGKNSRDVPLILGFSESFFLVVGVGVAGGWVRATA